MYMTSHKKILTDCTGFQWDRGNLEKNWIKHRVSIAECEQVFFNHPLVVAPDVEHSKLEPRYYALGHTDMDRRLFLVFTIRNKKIRVISARNMSKREKEVYES